MVEKRIKQENIHLGRHGEDYGNWMSNPVFYMAGGLLAITAVLAVLSFTVFHITVLGMIFTGAAVVLLALLLWITWIRRQYAFDGGGMMEKVHQILLSHLDYDGKGNLLEVGCGIRSHRHRLLGHCLSLQPIPLRKERSQRRGGLPMHVPAGRCLQIRFSRWEF